MEDKEIFCVSSELNSKYIRKISNHTISKISAKLNIMRIRVGCKIICKNHDSFLSHNSF